MSLGLSLALIIIAFVGGLCITTIGPGGIFVTIALYLLLDLEPGSVAGVASAAFIGTGLVGSAAYLRSGELASPEAMRASAVLSLTSIVGAFGGAKLNAFVEPRLFGILLGGFVIAAALIIFFRQRGGLSTEKIMDLADKGALWKMAAVGIIVGLPGGLLGVGGPVLAVPLMVVLGVPMLLAVALAQVQSIFIALFATAGYLTAGVIKWYLVLLVGVPLLVGTIGGWVVARRIQPARLKVALVVVLLGLGLYLLAGGGTPG